MLRSLLEAVLLGVVQGLTEFIPVSSSAHLVIVPRLLGIEAHGLAFDVALHIGTFAAVVAFFHAEIMAMGRGVFGLDRSAEGQTYRRVALLIAAGTVPVALVGFVLEDVVAEAFASPVLASSFLLLTAALLFGGERIRDRRTRHVSVRSPAGQPPGPVDDAAGQTPTGRLPVGRDAEDPRGTTLDRIGLRQALLVGLSQCVALFPGVSRSGTTIVAGMAAGMTREAATRFSFLLALPALAGAALLSADGLVATSRTFSNLELAAGVLGAFISGYLAIRFLVALVARDRLTGFAWYCLALGSAGIVGFTLIT